MKYSFIPLFVAVVVVMTSLSECVDLFDGMLESPISADINGVTYSSEVTTNRDYGARFTESDSTGKYYFVLDRYLNLNKDNYVLIEIELPLDSFVIGYEYTDFKVKYTEFLRESPAVFVTCEYESDNADGWIEFTDRYKEKKYPNYRRIAGKFEFTFTDDVTAKTYEITNGVFDVPYKDSKKE